MTAADARRVSGFRLHLVGGKEHAHAAVDHIGDAFPGRCGTGLEHERQEQRGLARFQELLRRQLMVRDVQQAGLALRRKVLRQPVDAAGDDGRIITPADIRHSFRDRHDGPHRGSALGAAQQFHVGGSISGQ